VGAAALALGRALRPPGGDGAGPLPPHEVVFASYALEDYLELKRARGELAPGTPAATST